MKKIMAVTTVVLALVLFTSAAFASQITWEQLKAKASNVTEEVAYAKLVGTFSNLTPCENIIVHAGKNYASPTSETVNGQATVFFMLLDVFDGTAQNFTKFGTAWEVSTGVWGLKNVVSRFLTEDGATFYRLNAETGERGNPLLTGTLIQPGDHLVYGVGGVQVPENIYDTKPGEDPNDDESGEDPVSDEVVPVSRYGEFGTVTEVFKHNFILEVTTAFKTSSDAFVWHEGKIVPPATLLVEGETYDVFVASKSRSLVPTKDNDLFWLTDSTVAFSDYGPEKAYKRYLLTLAFDWVVPENCYVLFGSEKRVATGTVLAAGSEILIGIVSAPKNPDPDPGSDSGSEGGGGGGGCNSGLGGLFGLLTLLPFRRRG